MILAVERPKAKKETKVRIDVSQGFPGACAEISLVSIRCVSTFANTVFYDFCLFLIDWFPCASVGT